ncbi:MAG TPA: DinB family protein [Anaerolineales bacterium]|nr:DinB family protein [Anaerolineales bacterium]
MDLRDVSLLYDYNYWATRRILAAGASVSPEPFINPAAHSFGSLRGTLVHTLDAEYSWRMLLQHNTIDTFRAMQDEDFPTLGSLEQRWNQEEGSMREYLASLSQEDVNGIIRYTTPEGEKRERVLWHCLLHVVNHGTHHRSEAAAILTGNGQSPGDLDFTVFLNERG